MLTDYMAAMIPLIASGQTTALSSRKSLPRCRTICAHDLPYQSLASSWSRGYRRTAKSRQDRVPGDRSRRRQQRANRRPDLSGYPGRRGAVDARQSRQRQRAAVHRRRDPNPRCGSKIINGKLHGEQETNKLTSLIRNAFIEHWEREGEDLRAIKMRAMQQSDLDRVNLFCERHAPLKLDPAKMLRTATEIDGCGRQRSASPSSWPMGSQPPSAPPSSAPRSRRSMATAVSATAASTGPSSARARPSCSTKRSTRSRTSSNCCSPPPPRPRSSW